MRRTLLLGALVIILMFAGCGGSGGGAAPGSPSHGSFTVGNETFTINHGTADYETTTGRLYFSLVRLTVAAPNAYIDIDDASSISAGQTVNAYVEIKTSTGEYYESGSTSNLSDPQAEVTFTVINLKNGGGISGTITGTAWE